MADITSPERFVTLQWKRGTGYYGAHKHASPYSWDDFKHNFRDQALSVVKARYLSYLLSWWLHHGKDIEPDRIHPKYGNKILEQLKEKIAQELNHQESMKGAKPKQTKRRK